MTAENLIPNGQAPALPFSDASGCQRWLEEQLHSSADECHAGLAAALEALPAAALAPAAKLECLERMRDAVALVQLELARRCRGKPVPPEPEEQRAWERVVGLWRAMARAYEALLEPVERAGAREAALACQRALRYTGLAIAEHARAYRAVDGTLWRDLHRLYALAESKGLARLEVRDPVGRLVAETSCAATYCHALLAQLAQPDALTLQQMDWVERWLEHWAGFVGLAREPAAASAIPALAVDLESARGARFASAIAAGKVRHLRLDALAQTLRRLLGALRDGLAPHALGLGEVPADACERLLLLLNVQWCAAGTGRMDERAPSDLRVTVLPSLRAIHYQLTGQPFRQPPGARAEPVTLTHRAEPPETWQLVNRSASGFLALARKPRPATRVAYGQLLGLQAAAGKVLLGLVQRLVVDVGGAIRAGIRLIPGAPEPAAARIADIPGSDPEALRFDRALLLPEHPAPRTPASIILPPGWYQANRIVEVHTGTLRRLRLRTLLDAGPNFDRAGYAIVGA